MTCLSKISRDFPKRRRKGRLTGWNYVLSWQHQQREMRTTHTTGIERGQAKARQRAQLITHRRNYVIDLQIATGKRPISKIIHNQRSPPVRRVIYRILSQEDAFSLL